jgi:hypothetical protein
MLWKFLRLSKRFHRVFFFLSFVWLENVLSYLLSYYYLLGHLDTPHPLPKDGLTHKWTLFNLIHSLAFPSTP